MFLSYIILLSLIPLFILFKPVKQPSYALKNPPPSPPKLPVIGNLHQLGSRVPHRYLHELAQKHSPLMLIHLGSVPVLVASTAETARQILKTHDLAFSNRPRSSISDLLTYGSKDIAFSPYGEYWRQIKSIAMVQLLSNRQVQSFRQVREEEIAGVVNVIRERCGSCVDLSELLYSLTNNVICRVALGRAYMGFSFRDMLRRLTYFLSVYSVGNHIPWLSWVDWVSGLERRANKVAREFDDFLEGVIEEHLNRRKEEVVDGKKGQDLVDILLDVQSKNTDSLTIHRDTVKAVILDLFAAGTDTTSTSMEWAISELVRHPKVMEKLQQEAREVAQGKDMISEDDLEKMQYLKAVIKETLRLHPPIPLLVPRESTKYVNLMGYDIPKGTQVIINVWAIGTDPSQWQEPEKFRPERFLNSDIDYKGNHFELLPFGAGRRGCPGIQFAIAVNELALANLAYKYDFTLPNNKKGEELDMSETNGMAAHKKSPLLVVVTPHVY